ncbi:MAG TPA: hypothetical protein GX729_04555 [Firmicutes bacterium]|nr:hypothetical protein [Bacillota bacterium]
MSGRQRIAYVCLGVVIGVCLSMGTLAGLAYYAPHVILDLQQAISGTVLDDDPAQALLDQSMVKSLVQDILCSEQGKALVNDIIRNQAPSTFRQMLDEAMASPEFRAALGEALGSFLNSDEGTELMRRLTQQIMTQ